MRPLGRTDRSKFGATYNTNYLMEYVRYSKPRAQSWRWHVLDRPAALLLIRTIALGAEPSSDAVSRERLN